MRKKIAVTTCCRSRFYIFEQAIELQRSNLLNLLIADYPLSLIREQTNLPLDKVCPLFFDGVLNHGYTRVRRYLPEFLKIKADFLVHDCFSRRVANKIPQITSHFIAMSSFALHGLRHCREQGIVGIVDHASLHNIDSFNFVLAESKYWSVRLGSDFSAKWVTVREDEEFKEAKHVFVPSTVSRDSLVRNGVDASKIFVNGYGVNLDIFSPVTAMSGQRDFNVIQVGNLGLNKGTLSLIDAFNRAKIKNSKLYLVGSVSREFD